MSAYYNENDKFAAAWLRELIKAKLIADGEVDERSITDVTANDVQGFTQCHFFAGIGGWSYALRLAGWPDEREVWTGSCPCQRHSSATRGRVAGFDYWPTLRRLVAANRPCALFSEQVAHTKHWFDGVCDDLDRLDYRIGAAVLPACSVGFDHARPRLFFVGHPNGNSQSGLSVDAQVAGLSRDRSDSGDMVSEDGVSGRMAVMRGFGNAIVPQVAQVFIEAYMSCVSDQTGDEERGEP